MARKKGTVWYFSDIVMAITSMMTVLFMLFVATLIVFVLNAQLDVNVYGTLMYNTPKTDTILLTFMDSSSGEHTMKELLSYATWKESTNFTLGDRNVDLKTTSKELMDEITNKAYRISLETDEKSFVLASAGEPEAVNNIKSETMVQGWDVSGKIILVVAE